MKTYFLLLLFAIGMPGLMAAREQDPCADKPNNFFVASTRGCAYYFTCNNNTGYEQFCPAGFWFNQRDQTCDLPQNVNCTLDLPPADVECPTSGIHRVPHPFLCDRYIHCVGGQQSEIVCDAGEHFSSMDDDCVPKEYAFCVHDPVFCPPIEKANQITFVANTRTCRSYFICTQPFIMFRECAPGTRYHDDSRWCDLPANSKCTIKNPPGYPDMTETDKCPQNSTTISFLEHPETCEFYFLCSRGESILRRCPADLWFDFKTETCNKKENVVCNAPSAKEPEVPMNRRAWFFFK